MDFGGMFKTWLNVLTRPGEEVFEEERQSENATFATTFIWIAIAAVIAAIFSVFSALISITFNIGSNLDRILAEIDPTIAEQLGPILAVGAGTGYLSRRHAAPADAVRAARHRAAARTRPEPQSALPGHVQHPG